MLISCHNLKNANFCDYRAVLSKYIPESRNLKKINHFERRSKLLHVGKKDIVEFLTSLPKTQHDLTSFNVDLLIFRVSIVLLFSL